MFLSVRFATCELVLKNKVQKCEPRVLEGDVKIMQKIIEEIYRTCFTFPGKLKFTFS